jgi:hypothetical protein
MSDIIGFLFFAFAFYLLVRFGCFAPLMYRNRGEQPSAVNTGTQRNDQR